MKILADEISLNVEIDETLLNKELIPVLFLHGFTGSSRDWKFLLKRIDNQFLPCAIDIIGHGKSDSPDNSGLYTAEAISKQIDIIITKLGFAKVIICGYSMGGRAALTYYTNYPGKVIGLILESSTPGIEGQQLRDNRTNSDALLIEKIKKDGVEQFCRYWFNLPLFESLKSLPQEELNNLLDIKFNNNPVGLCNSLKGFGTGTMPALWNKLSTINFPVLFITGKYDDKFTEINQKANSMIANSVHKIIKDCGHNAHLEKPEEFINLVNKYLLDNFSGT